MIFETYSKRRKKIMNQEISDVYEYDELKITLRTQIMYIWRDAIGSNNDEAWEFIHNTIARELGITYLGEYNTSFYNRCIYFLSKAEIEETLDIIELSFRIIDNGFRNLSYYDKSQKGIILDSDDAIIELNHRFKEHGVGYEFIKGEIIRIDNEFIHQEAVKPAIKLLYDGDFEGASDEFFNSYEHFRKGEYKEAIVDALKSFESTMKTICEKKSYTYDKTKDTASKLISILILNGLIPEYLSNHFTGLRTTLAAGLPTVRNKTSGHGQGINTIDIPEYFVSYAINLAATNIVFLVNAYNKSK
ncbi:STM4504/CBY_0614 family protein [Clostridium estertheticum]|uniref:STM4504/CBY_0614 family protein n=1 Tax=Clostridium estertheticum TaxID=238834 RepID=UPI001CF1EC40|nr:hypothetical protein [Clostridium estertheticum]MCB2362238.1 hypothetical protein [Clostridium estertheticum]